MSIEEVIAAIQELVELGVLEDSGLRRPDKAGTMQVVWRTSSFGQLVSDYQERFGVTFEEALRMVPRRHS